VARPSGLGRGLGALIPRQAAEGGPDDDAVLLDLPIGDIVPNPNQPRSHFDEETLEALTGSVRELGVLQPVLVRDLGAGRYELVAGERRWRAAKRAGLASIPAVVRESHGAASLETALVENLHRQDLNPLEEAAAYRQLLDDFGFTHEELARRVGRSRPALSNALRLFQLSPSLQRLVADGRLSAGHARALLPLADPGAQEALARKAIAEELSVRQVEEAVRARVGGRPRRGPKAPETPRPPGLLELEELLSDRLSTRVSVTMGAKRGRVVIDFATLEDLERIYRAMTATST
jgi:ParB family transcriptional regulator, chromosome partitioning protein